MPKILLNSNGPCGNCGCRKHATCENDPATPSTEHEQTNDDSIVSKYLPFIDDRFLYLAITADVALWGALAFFGYHYFIK